MSWSVAMAIAFLTRHPLGSARYLCDQRRLPGGFERLADEVGHVADQSHVEVLADRLRDVIGVGFVRFGRITLVSRLDVRRTAFA